MPIRKQEGDDFFKKGADPWIARPSLGKNASGTTLKALQGRLKGRLSQPAGRCGKLLPLIGQGRVTRIRAGIVHAAPGEPY